jgi:glucosamine 6-phosphate synthetase-like amidotransferase/phosphosugar isomerase protein
VLFSQSNFAVGHNRSATKGKINAECTHPFRENHITLVHNGTLTSHKELHPNYEVDSRAICHNIAQEGYEETLKKLDGAFALIWFNSKEKTLNFCRNSQRPLYIIETTTSFVLVSELNLGLWILSRNNEHVIKSSPVEIEKVYSFSMDNFKSYAETPVKYLEYKPVYNKWINYFQDDAIEDNYASVSSVKSQFAFGEKIKFKTGDIINNYVEGDILKHQNIGIDYIVDGDFEAKWRIKIYGSKEYLNSIANMPLAIGTVGGTITQGTETTYTVSSVKRIEKKSNILHLPVKVVTSCFWCKEETHNVLAKGESQVLCDKCSSMLYGAQC